MLIDDANSESQRLQINHGVVKAGRSLPGAAHPAPYDEVYYVLSGRASLDMDGVDYDLEPGTVVFIPAGTFHALTNESQTEDFVILKVLSTRPRDISDAASVLQRSADVLDRDLIESEVAAMQQAYPELPLTERYREIVLAGSGTQQA